MSNNQNYLDPEVINSLSGLQLQARRIVEGYVTGMHESPYKGASVEFAQHREYVPGDDLRHLDWKVFGRTDRLYVKEYEQETNLRVYLLVDISKSMDYASGDISKLNYARWVTASLAYLIIKQQDGVGVITFDEEIKDVAEPASSAAHFRKIAGMLSDLDPSEKTNMGDIMGQVADRLEQRSLVILISDLFDDVEHIETGFSQFRHHQHDFITLQILDPYEVEFPIESMTEFKGMELPDELLADPTALREAYLEEIQDHNTRVEKACLANKMDYRLIQTDQDLGIALSTYLARRMGKQSE